MTKACFVNPFLRFSYNFFYFFCFRFRNVFSSVIKMKKTPLFIPRGVFIFIVIFSKLRLQFYFFALFRRAIQSVEDIGRIKQIVDIRASGHASDDRGAEREVLGVAHIVYFEARFLLDKNSVLFGKELVIAAVLQANTTLVSEEVDKPFVMIDILRPCAGEIDAVLRDAAQCNGTKESKALIQAIIDLDLSKIDPNPVVQKAIKAAVLENAIGKETGIANEREINAAYTLLKMAADDPNLIKGLADDQTDVAPAKKPDKPEKPEAPEKPDDPVKPEEPEAEIHEDIIDKTNYYFDVRGCGAGQYVAAVYPGFDRLSKPGLAFFGIC